MKIKFRLCALLIIFSLFFMGVGLSTEASTLSVEGLYPTGKLQNAILLYIGSSDCIINNTITKIDPNNSEIIPIIQSDRTLIPVRFIAESLNATVQWKPATSTVVITKNQNTIEITIGERRMMLNHIPIMMDIPAKIKGARTYLPLRAICEALKKEVFFDRNLIIVSDKEKILDAVLDKKIVDTLISALNNLDNKNNKQTDDPVFVSEDEINTIPFKIKYSLNGGIAGFCDTYQINSEGEFQYTKADKVLSKGIIDKSDLDKIREYALKNNNFIEYSELPKKLEGNYPDKLTVNFTIYVKGITGSSKQEARIIDMLKGYALKFN